MTMKKIAKKTNLKHNNNMHKRLKIGLIGASLFILIFFIQPLSQMAYAEQSASNSSEATTEEFEKYVECTKKAKANNKLIGNLELQQECGKEIPLDCDLTGAWSWIMCPLITTVGNGVDSSYSFLKNFFKIDVKFFETQSEVHQVWQQIRNLANVGLVIYFMIIVVSQITGRGLSNYGIKRTMPKLIVAVILINLSYFVAQTMIDLSNIIGVNIFNLFQAMESSLFISVKPSANTVTAPGVGVSAIILLLGVTAIHAIAVQTALYALLMPMFISFIMTVVVTGLFLIARQAVAIVLVVLSPIAFLTLIFPNTEKIYNFWKRLMTGVLVLFPVAGFLFGGANFVSALLANSSNTFLMQAIALIMTGLPLVFLPALVKNTIAAIPTIGSKMTGVLDKARNKAVTTAKNSKGAEFSRKKAAQRRADLRLGNYKGINPLLYAQKHAQGAVLGATASGRATLQSDIKNQTDSIESLASGMDDTDLITIANAAQSNKLDELDISNLSIKTRQAIAAQGMSGRNMAEIAMAANLKLAKDGDLNYDQFRNLTSYASSNGLNQNVINNISENIRKESVNEGRFDTAGYIKGLQRDGNVNTENINNKNDNWRQDHMMNELRHMNQNQLAALSADSLEVQTTNGRVTHRSPGAQAMYDLYRSDPNFKANIDNLRNNGSPLMNASTLAAINEALK